MTVETSNIQDYGAVKAESKVEFAEIRKDLGKFLKLDERQAQRLLDMIRYISGERIKEYLSTAAEDVRYVHKRLQVLILKETVLTEVSYSFRHQKDYDKLVLAIVWAYNLPDEWWIEGGDSLTIQTWAHRIAKAWEDRPVATPNQSNFHLRMEEV